MVSVATGQLEMRAWCMIGLPAPTALPQYKRAAITSTSNLHCCWCERTRPNLAGRPRHAAFLPPNRPPVRGTLRARWRMLREDTGPRPVCRSRDRERWVFCVHWGLGRVRSRKRLQRWVVELVTVRSVCLEEALAYNYISSQSWRRVAKYIYVCVHARVCSNVISIEYLNWT